MKANRVERGPGRRKALVALVAAVILISATVICYRQLKSVYNEQSLICDMTAQVSIRTGKMVPADTIAAELGLRKGVCIADVDLEANRVRALSRMHCLQTIRIARELPDKVSVVVEERSPVARIEPRGSRRTTGRVVDTEGMVFVRQRGTQSLPVIREGSTPGLQQGVKVTGRMRAALHLVEACRETEFLELGLLEVDTTKRDFLTATLGNYSKVKILWKDMDEPTAETGRDLVARLTQLRDVIRNRLMTDTVIWNATMPGRIFADTQGRL